MSKGFQTQSRKRLMIICVSVPLTFFFSFNLLNVSVRLMQHYESDKSVLSFKFTTAVHNPVSVDLLCCLKKRINTFKIFSLLSYLSIGVFTKLTISDKVWGKIHCIKMTCVNLNKKCGVVWNYYLFKAKL